MNRAIAAKKNIHYKHFLTGFLTGIEICQFINNPLTKEYRLKATKMDKPIFKIKDLIEVLQYHWATNTNIFSTERQRV